MHPKENIGASTMLNIIQQVSASIGTAMISVLLANQLSDDSRRRGRIVRQWASTLDVVLKEQS